MELIEQMKSIVETNQSLKEENSKFTDTLDEKDEEIKKLKLGIGRQQVAVTDQSKEIKRLTEANQILDTKLTQKSSEIDLLDKRLSHEHNGVSSKLANREKQIKELKEQIDQTKINAIEAKDNQIAVLKEDINFHCETFENQIAVLKQKNKELESQHGKAQDKAKASLQAIFTEFMTAVAKSGFVKQQIMTGRYANNKPKYKTYYVQQDMAEHLKEYPQLVAQKQGENRLNRNS